MKYNDILTAIESETDFNSMMLHEIADHGANNIYNCDLSESDNIELMDRAKCKIAELERAESTRT